MVWVRTGTRRSLEQFTKRTYESGEKLKIRTCTLFVESFELRATLAAVGVRMFGLVAPAGDEVECLFFCFFFVSLFVCLFVCLCEKTFMLKRIA
jgi:hypothetical protein